MRARREVGLLQGGLAWPGWFCLACLGACSFQSAPLTSGNSPSAPKKIAGPSRGGASVPSNSGVPDGAAPQASATGTGGKGGSGSGGGGGAAIVDAGWTVLDLKDSGAPQTPDPIPDAATPPPDRTPGGVLWRCVTNYGCASGLSCYGSGPGFCTETCASDNDCTDLVGVDFTCSSNTSQCRATCSAAGADAECPSGFACVDESGGPHCTLPPEQGTHDRTLLEACDRAHGDADCVDGLLCYRPSQSHIDGPGFCTASCGRGGKACKNSPPGTAVECNGTACRFPCSNSDCPPGMACEEYAGYAYCHIPP